MPDASFELEDNLVVLDGGVVELFVRGVGGGPRLHVRHMSIHTRGQDRHGRTRVHFAPGPDPMNGFRLEVPPERWSDLDAFVARCIAAREGRA